MIASKLFALADKLEAICKWTAAACLMGMALLTGADILIRGAFNSPILGVEEMVAVLAVLTTGLSLAYSHSQGSNIGVEFLISKLGKKARNRMRLCNNIVSATLFSVVTWRMALYAASMQSVDEMTMTLEIPKHYIIYALTFGFGCLALVQIRDVARQLLEDK